VNGREVQTERNRGANTVQIVKELATAVSTQAQVTNRFWLTLMTVAIFALLPRVASTDAQTITLPLGLGSVTSAALNPILFTTLAVLIVAFAAAHSQQVRAQKLAQDYIDTLPVGADDGVHARELFDMLRQPSVTRVAPLAQSLRGKYQFIATKGNCPPLLWWSSLGYYLVLKVASTGIYFLLPGWALWSIGTRVREAQVLWAPIFWIAGVLASFALLQVTVTELLYMGRVAKHLSVRR
jgi:hypothetical protein